MDIRQSVIPVSVFDVSEGTVACHINGLEQDCGISSGLAMEIQQSCHEPSIYLINMDISLPLMCQHEQGLRLTLIRHRSDTKVSDRCLINIDPKVCALWDTIFIYIFMLCCFEDIQIIFWVYWLIIQRSCRGVYWFHSVRPSVHPSRIPCPLCSTYSSGLIHFIFIHLIKQLQKVCRV